MLKSEIVAQFNLGALFKLHPQQTLDALHQEWGHFEISKARGDAGEHGIPQIGRQESAFHRSLTAGQKDAVRDLQAIVEQLHERGGGWGNVDARAIDEPLDEWKAKALHELATKPLEAFLLGQILASEHLDQWTHKPVTQEDQAAVAFLQAHTLNELSEAFENVKHDVRRELINGIELGKNPREVARALENVLGDHETNWNAIAITETARAESQGRLREYEDAGEEYVVGSSAHDAKVCDKCLELIDGKRYTIASVIGKSNYGRKKDDWIAVIPCHVNCRCVWLPYTP